MQTLTYGQKLIAEAIEAHFGERVENYDEDVDDTSNHDAWEAFDALAALSQAEQAGGAGQEGTVVFPDEGEQRYWRHPAKGHIWDEEQAQDVADRLRVAYGAGNVAEEAADLIEALLIAPPAAGAQAVPVEHQTWGQWERARQEAEHGK